MSEMNLIISEETDPRKREILRNLKKYNKFAYLKMTEFGKKIVLPVDGLVGQLKRNKLVNNSARLTDYSDLSEKEAVLDIGRHPKSSRLFAALKGAVDAGLSVPHSEKVLPSDERIKGKHIDEYMATANGVQFSKYKAKKISVEKNFEAVLSKIKGKTKKGKGD